MSSAAYRADAQSRSHRPKRKLRGVTEKLRISNAHGVRDDASLTFNAFDLPDLEFKRRPFHSALDDERWIHFMHHLLNQAVEVGVRVRRVVIEWNELHDSIHRRELKGGPHA